MGRVERRAADWLKRGGRMLSSTCPNCGSPLFEIGGEVWCPRCNQPVLTAENKRLVLEIESLNVLQRVEETLITRIGQVETELRRAKSLRGVRASAHTLYLLLSCLESVRKIKGG
ncbi:hypothetical protein DRO48_02530 [Candidatus Bathyarchaeota archaeon]|nr:MAG: hypothetical protein DRO48_02530 [Candidatus Bathyarchaeota archaeon]